MISLSSTKQNAFGKTFGNGRICSGLEFSIVHFQLGFVPNAYPYSSCSFMTHCTDHNAFLWCIHFQLPIYIVIVSFPQKFFSPPYVFSGRCITFIHAYYPVRTFACFSCFTWKWCQKRTVTALLTSSFCNRCHEYKEKVCVPCSMYLCMYGCVLCFGTPHHKQARGHSEHCYLIGAIIPLLAHNTFTPVPPPTQHTHSGPCIFVWTFGIMQSLEQVSRLAQG